MHKYSDWHTQYIISFNPQTSQVSTTFICFINEETLTGKFL